MNHDEAVSGDIYALRKRVLTLDRETGKEDLLDVMMLADRLAADLKAVRNLLDSVVLDWIKGNGSIQVGDVRYYVGPVTNVKCLQPEHAVQALFRKAAPGGWDAVRILETMLTESGGDLEAAGQALGGYLDQALEIFAGAFLSSGGLKEGAAKKALGEDFLLYFSVSQVDDVKTGKPKQEVKKADDRFMRRKS